IIVTAGFILSSLQSLGGSQELPESWLLTIHEHITLILLHKLSHTSILYKKLHLILLGAMTSSWTLDEGEWGG
ncbi:hypothetical protein ACJX0J_027511, partial [Zea mays]